MNPTPAAPAVSNARDAVNLPAIMVMISGILASLYSLFMLVAGKAINASVMNSFANDPRFADVMRNAQANQGGASSYIWPIFTLLLAGLTIAGAVKMRNLQSYGLAVTGSVVSMILFPACCCFGIPVAIWSIVVLMKPEVKSQFT